MAAIWGSVFGVLSFGSSLASSIFAYKAYSEAGSVNGGSSDSSISSARSLLLWAAILAWVTLAVIVIVILLFVFYYRSTYSISGFIVLIAVVLFILTVVIGILCALAASRIRSSSLYTNSGTVYTAYWDAIVGAILSLVTAAFILIIFIIYLVAYSNGAPKTEATVAPPLGAAIANDGTQLRAQIEVEQKRLAAEGATLIQTKNEESKAQEELRKLQISLAAKQQEINSLQQKAVVEQAQIASEQLRLSELQRQSAAVLQAQSLAATRVVTPTMVNVTVPASPPPAMVGAYTASRNL